MNVLLIYIVLPAVAVVVGIVGVYLARSGRVAPRTAGAVSAAAVGVLLLIAWFWPVAPTIDDSRGEAPPAMADQPPIEAASNAHPLSARSYAHQVAGAELFEIQAGQIAWNRAREAQVRNFGRRMAREHGQMQVMLAQARGKRLQAVEADAELDGPQREAIDALRRAPDNAFDSLYLRQQVDAHRKALALHSAYLAQARDSSLVSLATAASKKVRAHLIDLEQLDQ